MNVFFGLRPNRILATSLLGAMLVGGATLGAGQTAQADTIEQEIMLKGTTRASYFWDDSSGRAGDTGLPAIGKPMQKGMFASPSWPLGTEGYVTYKGKTAKFFIGDRGPGIPSNRGVMLDIDAKTFADLTGGRFNTSTLMVNGNGGMGHIQIDYAITKWGKGPGKKNFPVAFSTGAWSKVDRNPAAPPKVEKTRELKAAPPKPAEKPDGPASDGAPLSLGGPAPYGAASSPELAPKAADTDTSTSGQAAAPRTEENGPPTAGLVALVGLGAAGIGLYAGRDRLRRLVRRDPA
ncbi:hypothetical protein [Spongiactinospora sp. TRM90649]|uniref:hypothetical protein n=1 Tax=Spongiactinospora sp. TRM90649 TaxID=3031114 RepID=UPI0023F9D14B|nr:hypothetical protein [Spongiactinospora sp. TRM90649]MDF5757228.1 hypothetical protein [Spongiactinospora sp. TRM90649]